MPAISSITLFFTTSESSMMTAITSIAPTKAAVSTAIKPVIVNEEVEMLPPQSNITSATPTEAPLLMPNIDGPARGFLNAV